MKASRSPQPPHAPRGTRLSGGRLRARKRVPVRVFVAYTDVPSARQALARLTRRLRADRPDSELHPLLWRFQQLAEPRWREMALRDAAHADAIVLAVAEDTAFDASTDAWLHALAFRTGRRSVNVLTMIGETESWSISLTACATAAIAPAPDPVPAPASAREVFGRIAPKPLAAVAA